MLLLTASLLMMVQQPVASDLKQIVVRGTAIRYLDEGSGPPVIFVHGGNSDHRVWRSQRSAVAAKHRFIALDQRYFGNAPWLDSGELFSLQTHVADLVAFIEALNLRQVFLVGQSYGGVVVLAAVLEHPAIARGILVNEPPLTSLLDPTAHAAILRDWMQQFETMLAVTRGGDSVATARSFYEWVNGNPGNFDALPAATRAMRLENSRTIALQLRPATRAAITCAQLGTIAVPVTVTTGKRTLPYFMRVTETLHHCIPESAHVLIPEARHGAPEQATAAFNEVLLRALNGGR